MPECLPQPRGTRPRFGNSVDRLVDCGRTRGRVRRGRHSWIEAIEPPTFCSSSGGMRQAVITRCDAIATRNALLNGPSGKDGTMRRADARIGNSPVCMLDVWSPASLIQAMPMRVDDARCLADLTDD